MTCKLYLLGRPRLEIMDKSASHTLLLERKSAAVLAYVALEGATPKYKLAGWLWPESGEHTARNNMRQLLRRLRLAGGDVFTGEAFITLRPEVELDIRSASYLEMPSLELLRQDAELLEGFDYDDAPDFDAWLEATREELRNLRSSTADLEATRLEQAGNFKQALQYALIRLKLDVLSEASYRQVARLYYLLGDRSAASAVLQRCHRVLEAELGVTPTDETFELARMMEQGADLPDAPQRPSTALPAVILRPPVLAGRAREWALMEEAWSAGKMIFLSGEAGVGKSRLATDFLTSKGGYIRLQGRPGDTHIPYSANFRHLQAILKKYPDEPIPKWVRQTLAHWLPEFLAEDLPDPNTVNQIRFADAHRELFAILVRHHDAIFIDDLHFHDEASTQMGAHLLAGVAPLSESGLRGYIGCYRSAGEGTEHMDAFIAEMVGAGLAVLIPLEPLARPEVEILLEGLAVGNAGFLAAGLSRYTGGNPLFILETIKHLIETNTLARGLPERLVPPGRLATLVQRRLQHLSPTGLNLARIAAVAGTEFNLELAANVLTRSPLELAEALGELESAQILRGMTFVHDLLFEAVLDGIPTAVRQLLHARIAQFLEETNTPPARIAWHWLEAGDARKAAPQLLAASEWAQIRFQVEEAAQLRERAIAIYEAQGDTDAAFEALFFLHRDLQTFDYGERFERAITRLFQLAHKPQQRAKAHLVQASYLVDSFRADAGEAAARAGLQELSEGSNFLLRAELSNELALALGQQGRHQEALAVTESLQPDLNLPPNRKAKMFVLDATISLLFDVGRYQEGLSLAREAEVGWFELDNPVYGVSFIIRQARCLGYLGQSDEALSYLDKVEAWMAERGVLPTVQAWTDLWRGYLLTDKGYYTQALTALERIVHASGGLKVTYAQAYCGLARLWRLLGVPERARAALEAVETRVCPPDTVLRCRLEEAKLLALQDPKSALTMLETAVVPNQNSFDAGLWQLARAELVTPEVSLPLAQAVLQRASSQAMKGLEIAAHARLAKGYLALGDTSRALDHSEQGHALLARYTPAIDSREVIWTHYQVLEAVSDARARDTLGTLLSHLLEIADTRVPSVYRQSFLKHPVNQVVLTAALNAGFEVRTDFEMAPHPPVATAN